MFKEWQRIKSEHDQIMTEFSSFNSSSLEEKRSILFITIDHITTHFRDEEQLMRVFNYPLLREHIDAHGKIQEAFLEQVRSSVVENDITRLRQLVEEHIRTDDQRFEDFLRELDGLANSDN
jgi:hemerythrin